MCAAANDAMCRDRAYSITSSARPSSIGGISRPSALAALRLMINSNLVRCNEEAPSSGLMRCSKSPSFDHFVSAREHHRRHVEAERLGSLEVDHQLVLGRCLHWQVRRLLALEDAIDVAR